MGDFLLPAGISLTTPLDTATVSNYLNALTQAQNTLPWVGNLAGDASAMINAGAMKVFPRLALNPTAALSADQLNQWKMVYQRVLPIEQAVLANARQQAAAASAALANDIAFWNSVFRATLAVATVGASEAWSALTARLRQIRDARAAGDANIQAMKGILAAIPAGSPLQQQGANLVNSDISTRNALESKLNTALSALGPAAPYAKADGGLSGLGEFPIALGIAAAVIVAVTAAVSGIVAYYINWQKTTEAHRNALAQQAATNVQRAVDAGTISPQKGAELIQQLMGQLTASRTGWAVLITTVLALGGLGYWLAKRKRGSSAPAPAAG